MAKAFDLLKDNSASIGMPAGGFSVGIPSPDTHTLGAAASQMLTGAFSQTSSVVTMLTGRNHVAELPAKTTASNAGANVGANASAQISAQSGLEQSVEIGKQFVADVEAMQKPLFQALNQAADNLGFGQAAFNSFNPSVTDGMAVAGSMALAKAPMAKPIVQAVAQGISSASAVGQGISDVKNSHQLNAKQEAQLADEMRSLICAKTDPSTGEALDGPAISNDLNTQALAGISGAQCAQVMKEALMPAEMQPGYDEILAAQDYFENEVSLHAQGAELDDAVRMAAAGSDTLNLDRDLAAVAYKADRVGVDAQEAIVAPEILDFEYIDYRAEDAGRFLIEPIIMPCYQSAPVSEDIKRLLEADSDTVLAALQNEPDPRFIQHMAVA